jgi:hypothetical protein
MFPIAESAYSAFLAAAMDAKVSGNEVPMATRVMAVIESSIPRRHPSSSANEPTTAVTTPM